MRRNWVNLDSSEDFAVTFRRDGKREYVCSKEWHEFVSSHLAQFETLDLPDCITESEDAFWDFFDLGYYPYLQHHVQIPTISTDDLPRASRKLLLEIIAERLEHEPGQYFTKIEKERYLIGKTFALGLDSPNSESL